MTKHIASTVITLQIAAKHRPADCRMMAKWLLRAIVIIGNSSRIFGHSSWWKVGTTASKTLRESMAPCLCCWLISSSVESGMSLYVHRPSRASRSPLSATSTATSLTPWMGKVVRSPNFFYIVPIMADLHRIPSTSTYISQATTPGVTTPSLQTPNFPKPKLARSRITRSARS